MKVARTQVVEQYLLLNHTMADGISESLKEDETLFYNFIQQAFTDLGKEIFPDSVEYNGKLFDEYKQAFFNYLHSIIFGADAYCAFK